MKKISLCLSALLFCAAALAESRTEIVVKDGLVKTSTPQGDSLVRRGQKAVLEEGKEPTISLNNKIVETLLQLDRQIQAERSQSAEQIEYTSAQVYAIDTENVWKVGGTLRMPNKTGNPSTTCRIGTMSILQDMTFYDLEGNPLSYTLEEVKADEGYYHLQFPNPVQPDQEFAFLMITDFKQNIEDFQLLEKVDGQWISSGRNGTPYCLNYFHVILPNSAIFVKSEPAAARIEEQDGRVAVTMRNYTGEGGEGAFAVYFLWPEKDGTSLKGIPWTNAGPEAVEIYELFLREDIQSPNLWGELAVKLIGGGFYQEAYEAFQRCFNGHDSAVWDYTVLTWQGHLLDLQGRRDLAIEKYRQALAIKPEADMRHDQWSIVLDESWIQRRITQPFTETMLLYPELNYRQAYPQELPDPIIEVGVRIGNIYLGTTKEEILEKLGKPRRIFYGDKKYSLNNLPDRYFMIYPDVSIYIQGNLVKGITALSSFYHLPDGIRVGDSQQQVIEAYGAEYQLDEFETKDRLKYENLFLMFEIDKQERTITEINLQPQ